MLVLIKSTMLLCLPRYQFGWGVEGVERETELTFEIGVLAVTRNERLRYRLFSFGPRCGQWYGYRQAKQGYPQRSGKGDGTVGMRQRYSVYISD